MKVGINGLGRIGRAIFRNNLNKKYFKITQINDINPDNKNLAYQLKYDSTYGTLANSVEGHKDFILIDEKDDVSVFHHKDIHKVPWDVDVVIDSSGIHSNVVNARKIKHIKRYVVTHSPESKLVDKSVIIGVNEKTVKDDDKIISSSICDACAFAPTVNLLNKNYGVDNGFITTLHPWLNYQNLLDGQSVSFAYPGTTHGRYELGRSSINALIPKPTSCVTATEQALPWIKDKFLSFSFRVPTMTVSSADISVKLKNKTTRRDIVSLFMKMEAMQKFNIFHNSSEPLISKDFEKMEYSAVVDHRWTSLNDSNYLKLILWYDNEWGYSSLVLDLIKYLEKQ